MRIAFDAKRAFHNWRGLGNYSRGTIRHLTKYHPENEYLLFNTKIANSIVFDYNQEVCQMYSPTSLLGKKIPALWRSYGIAKQLKTLQSDIFHGLSQELPYSIGGISVKKIVTMHDTIFMRYPELYPASYRAFFIPKNRFACKIADRIIAISEQTKADIIKYFDADEKKVEVVYQGCNPIFRQPVSSEKLNAVTQKYGLPKSYILSVGAIEKRKNLGQTIVAMAKCGIEIPLVAVGVPTLYIEEVKSLIEKYKMENQVHLVYNAETADLPAIYANASLFVLPSFFEGFGIPVLEALSVGTPVICAKGTCFEETGGTHSIYIDPHSPDELGEAIKEVLGSSSLQEKMRVEGLKYAENFTDKKIADNLMRVYQGVV